MAEADASISGCCGVCIYSTLASWCILHPFGADVRCCGGPRGCCGSCCDSSFDKDDFDERMRKEHETKNGVQAEPTSSQPTPSHGMSAATNDPKPSDLAH